MDDIKYKSIYNKLVKHPTKEYTFLKHLAFCWGIPIIIKEWTKKNNAEFYETLDNYTSEKLGDELEKNWKYEVAKNRKSLKIALLKLCGWDFFFMGFMVCIAEIAFGIGQSYILQNLLNFFTPNTETDVNGVANAIALVLMLFFYVCVFHYSQMKLSLMGMKMRLACSSLIYKKSLELDNNTIHTLTTGKISNLLSCDATKLDIALIYIHFVWIGPTNALLSTIYVYYAYDLVAVSSILAMSVFMGIQALISKQLANRRKRVTESTDQRLSFMKDIISGIQVIKYYAWELPFINLVTQTREIELSHIRKSNFTRLSTTAVKLCATNICLIFPIMLKAFTNAPLTQQYFFGLAIILNSIKISSVILFQLGANFLAETHVSVQRIEEFLLTKTFPKQETATNVKGVRLVDVSVKWRETPNCLLEDVKFEASPGQLVGVVGPAGSGKSTLLQIILKEVLVESGFVKVGGLVSYAPQESWIFPSTLRQNIIFGEEFNQAKYAKILQICALEMDISLFPHGDETLVGERGVRLSGGQKARINLARAIYRTADVYLLDDPLSAVDANVAKHIFNNCICDYLKKKCVILVTHQIHFLVAADAVYEIKDGRMYKNENPKNLKIFEQRSAEEEKPLNLYESQNADKKRNLDTQVFKTIVRFLSSAKSPFYAVSTIVAITLGQIVYTIIDIFDNAWLNNSAVNGVISPQNAVYIISFINIIYLLVELSVAIFGTKFYERASRNLHNSMLTSILKAPLNFFNHTTSGTIINRFSNDLAFIDEALPFFLTNQLLCVYFFAGLFFNIAFLNGWSLIPSILTLIIVFIFTYIFSKSTKNTKNTQVAAQSRLLTYLSASIEGISVIKAFQMKETVIREFNRHQNVHTSSYEIYVATSETFGFWTDFLCIIYTTCIITSMFLISSEHARAIAGLTIMSAVNMVRFLQFSLKNWIDTCALLLSVDRIRDYGNLQSEPDGGQIRENWPSSGSITFDQVSLRYYPEEPPVLKNLSFEIIHGEKIGIIGRTGAGKSSLTSVLYRFFDFDGTVRIDGVDTKTLPLNVLRTNISIIPQNPIIFIGTIRKNIDPFDCCSDAEIWKSLEDSGLQKVIQTFPSGLESKISEQGGNISVGQKQLLCLVRAILKKNKIIILDEATANIDHQTDEMLQRTIRKKFKHCTVLTIAHRINTILDSDRIMVMDEGKIVEFDHPKVLLNDPESVFSKFVKIKV